MCVCVYEKFNSLNVSSLFVFDRNEAEIIDKIVLNV